MIDGASRAETSPHRVFQFRLATLLIATAWAGVVSLALSVPNDLWSGVIAVSTLLIAFAAVLLMIYRTGRVRAMTVGFLVFCVGYLMYLALSSGSLGDGLRSHRTPCGAAFSALFSKIHPPQEVTVRGGFGSFGEGGFGAGGGGLGSGTTTAMISTYELGNFVAISNHALACLLGVIGSVIAQFLYATSPPANRSSE